jgi:hypothetical protein
MKKVIPAESRIVCDRCGVERAFFVCGTQLRVEKTRRCGPLGEVYGGTESIDLCDDCSILLDVFMKCERIE